MSADIFKNKVILIFRIQRLGFDKFVFIKLAMRLDLGENMRNFNSAKNPIGGNIS